MWKEQERHISQNVNSGPKRFNPMLDFTRPRES